MSTTTQTGSYAEQIYCSQQINVPLNLPFILKQYAKAAIRTQPSDLLYWSAVYFRALADGTTPPVKERIEYPPIATPSGLTPGFIKLLIKMFGKGGIISDEDLKRKWLGVGLNENALSEMLILAKMEKNRVRWLNFVAVAAGYLCPSLTQTMIFICELLTDDADGGPATISLDRFLKLYKYLARLNCGPVTAPFALTHESIREICKSRDMSLISQSSYSENGSTKEKVISDLNDVEDETDEMTDFRDKYKSDEGLAVWHDPVPPVIKKGSPRPSKEGITSDSGLVVFENIAETPVTPGYSNKQIETPLDVQKSKKIKTKKPEIETQKDSSHDSLDEEEETLASSSQAHTMTDEIEEEEEKEAEAYNEEEQERVLDIIKPEEDEQMLLEKTLVKFIAQENVLDMDQKAKRRKQKIEKRRLREEKLKKKAVEHKPDSSGGEEEEKEKKKLIIHDEIGVKAVNIDEVEYTEDVPKDPEQSVSIESSTISLDSEESSILSGEEEQEEEAKEEADEEEMQSDEEKSIKSEESEDKKMSHLDKFDSDNILKGKDKKDVLANSVLKFYTDSETDMASVISEPDYIEDSFVHIPGIGPIVTDYQIEKVIKYMKECSYKQAGYVMPRNIRHFLCPPLDIECSSNEDILRHANAHYGDGCCERCQ